MMRKTSIRGGLVWPNLGPSIRHLMAIVNRNPPLRAVMLSVTLLHAYHESKAVIVAATALGFTSINRY